MNTAAPDEFRWSVTLVASGDRTMELEEIVALADAVAELDGIATGIGQQAYGAQVVVTAPTRVDALSRATKLFLAAARTAELPDWPLTSATALGEHEEEIAEADQWL